MPPLVLCVFFNVYFRKLKLQTWRTETAGLSVVTVGEGVPGSWQGLLVTLKADHKDEGLARGGSPLGSEIPSSYRPRIPGCQGNHV